MSVDIVEPIIFALMNGAIERTCKLRPISPVREIFKQYPAAKIR